jgi:hypothetical protein
MKKPFIVIIALCHFSLPRLQEQIGFKVAADAEQNKTLLLKDFRPKSMLHVKQTSVLRARFPVIDMHPHVNDAADIGERIPPAEVVLATRGESDEHFS